MGNFCLELANCLIVTGPTDF